MAVQVEHLWKSFQIPHERRTTLFQGLRKRSSAVPESPYA
jgi:hypothetical protein